MSPEPEVRSHRLPIRSVRRRGVVPWLDIWPFKSAFLWEMLSLMALVSASPEREAKSLSARYFSFSSLGLPARPAV